MHLFQLVRLSEITEEPFGGENHFFGRALFNKIGEAAGQLVGSGSSFAGLISVQENVANQNQVTVVFVSKNITNFQGTISLTLASGISGALNDTFDLDFGAPPPAKIANGSATKPAGCRLTWAAPTEAIAGFTAGLRKVGDCSCVRLQIFGGLPNTRYSFANIHTSGVVKRADAVTDANGNFDVFSDTLIDSSFALGDWQVRLIGPGIDVLCGGFRIVTESQAVEPPIEPRPIEGCPPGTRSIPGAPQLGCVPIEIPKPETCPEGQMVIGRNPDGSAICGTKAIEPPPVVLPPPGVECGTGETFDPISGRCIMSVPPPEPPGVICEPGTILGPGGECVIPDIAPPLPLPTDKKGLGILALILIALVAIGGEK